MTKQCKQAQRIYALNQLKISTWKRSSQLGFEIAELDPDCCKVILLQVPESTDKIRTERFGVYNISSELNNRPVYKHVR